MELNCFYLIGSKTKTSVCVLSLSGRCSTGCATSSSLRCALGVRKSPNILPGVEMTISNLLLQRQQTDLCDRPLELSSVRRLHRDNACHAVVSRVGCHNPTEWPLQWRCVVVNQQHQRALLDLLRLQPLRSLLKFW
uniref:(northern house mosquito) hypothetical protein n=1 Tax=Culex pipiens TaxID=7175 RepID=A0A8D8FMB3_CULPI